MINLIAEYTLFLLALLCAAWLTGCGSEKRDFVCLMNASELTTAVAKLKVDMMAGVVPFRDLLKVEELADNAQWCIRRSQQ